jgi:hypothetical protein
MKNEIQQSRDEAYTTLEAELELIFWSSLDAGSEIPIENWQHQRVHRTVRLVAPL